MNTSLFYEILLYLNSFYFGMFVLCELVMFIIKGLHLNFPRNTLLWELIILFTLTIIESVRILFGRKGNLTEQNVPVILSILLTIPSAVGVVYLLLWQTYVLRLEWILCVIQLSLYVVEIVFASFGLFPFYNLLKF